MKRLLYVFYILLAVLFLDGVTDNVAKLPNKSQIVYFAHMEGVVSSAFLPNLQERYDQAVYTNCLWLAPSTRFILNGKEENTFEINSFSPGNSLGKIRFKNQIFPRRYYMSYNPIGFQLYISDSHWNEYYGGIVLTAVTPEILGIKIQPFGRSRDFQIELPHWVNSVTVFPTPKIRQEIVVKFPEELQIFANSYIAPYLYIASHGECVVSSESLGKSEERNEMAFFDFPFYIYLNGRTICRTVSDLYEDRFLSDFTLSIGYNGFPNDSKEAIGAKHAKSPSNAIEEMEADHLMP